MDEATPTTDAQVDPLTHQEDETPAMIDAPATPHDTTDVEQLGGADPDAPSAPVAPTPPAAPAPASPPAAAPAAAPLRKPNRLMADLTKAMQAAAENARADALTRLAADAKTHIEGIHADSATEATELRRRADDDVASVREWSKAEIARIREETEQRIGDRKGALDREIEAHAAAIEQRIERVQARVAAFEAEMAEFFERIVAEDDPTRLANLAESLPEPPAFDGDVEDGSSMAVASAAPAVVETVESLDAEPVTAPEPAEAVADVAPETIDAVAETIDVVTETETTTDAATVVDPQDAAADLFSIGTDDGADGAQTPDADPRLAALGLGDDFAAAEAEAAALGTYEPSSDDEIPVIADDALAARLAGLVPESDAAPADVPTTRVVVTGLISVASIAGFKRHLSRVPGVESVGVSSGPDGEFVFAVGHGSDLNLHDAIATLPGFGARVTGGSDGDLHVTARDPEAEG